MSQNIYKIIYINLEIRPDRKTEIENELILFDLSFERFNAIEYLEFGIYGCLLSHLEVIKIAKANNYPNILILEDDFKFTVSKSQFETAITQLFENPEFDVCMFSYLMGESKPPNKVIKAETASGYLIQSHYYDKLIELYTEAAPLLIETRQHWIYANDQIWHKLQSADNWIYLEPRIGIQRPSFSNNSNIFRDIGV